jgi:hypothetical protein
MNRAGGLGIRFPAQTLAHTFQVGSILGVLKSVVDDAQSFRLSSLICQELSEIYRE